MKKKNIAWGLFFIFLAAVYLVISSTGMELGVGLPGIFMTVLFVWLFVEGIKDVNFYSIVFGNSLYLHSLQKTSWTGKIRTDKLDDTWCGIAFKYRSVYDL